MTFRNFISCLSLPVRDKVTKRPKMSFLTKVNSVFSAKALKLAGSWFQQSKTSICISPLKRFYIKGIQRGKFKEVHYLKKDKIPEGFSIIYRVPMENYLFAAKEITTLTSIGVGLMVFYRLLKQKWLSFDSPSTPLGSLYTSESDTIYFLCGFIVITAAVRLMIRRLPLRIYKNQSKYIAVFEGQFPLRKTKTHFERGEVAEVPPSRVNPWSEVTFQMKGNRVIMIIDYFKTPSEFFEMFNKKEE